MYGQLRYNFFVINQYATSNFPCWTHVLPTPDYMEEGKSDLTDSTFLSRVAGEDLLSTVLDNMCTI